MDPELYQAVLGGNHSFFENLTNDESDILLQVTSGHKNNTLHIAAKCGRMQMAEKIISLSPSLLHQTNSKGDSPLHIAARLGRLEMCQLLMNCAKLVEVEVEKELLRMENLDNDTALHDAVRNGHFEIMSLLINEDPELTQVVNGAGESPLFLAVDRKFYKIANHMLKAAPMCSYLGRNNMNVLHASIIRADKRFPFMITNMIVNAIALCSKFLVMSVSLFLPSAAKIQCLRFTQFHRFSYIGADFMREIQRRYPSAVAEADEFGWIPLHYAVYLGNAEVVELFLELDVSLAYMKDKEGMSALHIAAGAGQDHVVEKIINQCPDTFEILDNRGRTALHVAAEKGKSNVVKIFLLTGVIGDLLNEQDKDGNTPFHLAALGSHDEVSLLLANDPRVDKGATNKAGLTAFDIVRSTAQLTQHKKATILWRLKAQGLLQSLKQVVITENKKVQAVEQPGQSQLQQVVREGPVTLSGIASEEGYNAEINQVKHNAIHSEAEPRKVQSDVPQHFKETGMLNLLVATIVASATFAAALWVPHGQDQGMTSLRKNSSFGLFMISSSLTFGLSTASMFLHYGASSVKTDYVAAYLIKYAFLFNAWSIYSLVLAFLAGTSMVLAGSVGLTAASVLAGCCFLLGPIIYTVITSNFCTN